LRSYQLRRHRVPHQLNIKVSHLPREGRNDIGREAADIYGVGCVVGARIWMRWWCKAVGGVDVQMSEIGVGVGMDGEIQPVDSE